MWLNFDIQIKTTAKSCNGIDHGLLLEAISSVSTLVRARGLPEAPRAANLYHQSRTSDLLSFSGDETHLEGSCVGWRSTDASSQLQATGCMAGTAFREVDDSLENGRCQQHSRLGSSTSDRCIAPATPGKGWQMTILKLLNNLLLYLVWEVNETYDWCDEFWWCTIKLDLDWNCLWLSDNFKKWNWMVLMIEKKMKIEHNYKKCDNWWKHIKNIQIREKSYKWEKLHEKIKPLKIKRNDWNYMEYEIEIWKLDTLYIHN